MKPKLNLKFFDEEYFNKILTISFVDSLSRVLKKTKIPVDRDMRAYLRRIAKTILSKHLNSLEEVHKSLLAERDKFSEYANNIKKIIDALKQYGGS